MRTNKMSNTKFNSATSNNSEIGLWLLDIRQFTPSLFALADSMMSQQEQARAQKILRGKNEFIASRWLMRRVLSHYTNISPDALAFKYSTKGKPALLDSDYHFSLSHSGHWAALAVGKQDWLGVDIEMIRPSRDLKGIARDFFHPDEFTHLCSLSEEKQTHYFYQLWTLKEAFFKALGSGISAGLEKACFIINGEHPTVNLSPELETAGASMISSDWQFFQTTVEPGVEFALAYQAQQPASIEWLDPFTLNAIDT